MNTYNWNARDYEKNSQSQQNWARELIKKLSLQGNEDVLDIGCGDGKVTADIATLLPNGSVVGVDSSGSMIELATEKYPGHNQSNLSFQVMDVRSMSFENCFDVVFSNAALHWVKDHQPVLEGIHKSLRPGGRILLQMGGEGNAKGILSVLEELTSLPEWQAYFQNFEFLYGFYGTKEYMKLLEKSGFDIKRVELIPKDMIHDEKSDLDGWIRTTWLPYTERVPSEKRDHFINALSSKYMERIPKNSNEKINVAMVRLEVEAEKDLM
jgi:trans-aconitate 2-methyltransferase